MIELHSDPIRDIIDGFDEVLFDLCRNDDYVGIYREIERRLGGGWMPIEKAPKDGELFIGLRLSVVVDGKPEWMIEDARWQDGRYRFRSTVRVSPTHWKPFAPPAQ